MRVLSTRLIIAIIICAISNTGWSQNTQSASLSSEQPANKETSNHEPIALTGAVITIQGLCDATKPMDPEEKPCATVVTQEAFEKLISSMNVTKKPLSQETRRNLAETYADYLMLERPAVEAGLENTPQFSEVMRWWRLRTLADMYRGALRTKFAHPSAEEIHAHYTEKLPSFDRVRVERVVIPRSSVQAGEKSEADQKAFVIAQAARERMAKGEAAALVQKDIYAQLKMEATPVPDLGRLGRSNFPQDEVDEVFSLAPGQVSKVEKEASYVIYKINAKEALSEESQKEEIAREIAQQKFNDAMRAVSGSVKFEFNDAYLGPPVAPGRSNPGGTINPHP
ncbi:MAG: peptidylprolyl isomerase [Candidatus Sulfotelmatobacter sp.]